MNVVGVVMARGGSKGLPGKNLAKVGKHTLVERAVLAARQAKTLHRVILTTDSPEMARLGKRAGAEVPFLRPKHLASDKAHSPDVVEHAIRFIEKRDGSPVDIVVTLQPTSPFRRGEHIDAAVHLLLKNPKFDSVIGVKNVPFPPYWMFLGKNNLLNPLINDGVDYSILERQQIPQTLQPNGAVYVTRRGLLRDKGLMFSAYAGGKTGFLLMDDLSSMDIDHPIDLLMVRTALTQHPELQ